MPEDCPSKACSCTDCPLHCEPVCGLCKVHEVLETSTPICLASYLMIYIFYHLDKWCFPELVESRLYRNRKAAALIFFEENEGGLSLPKEGSQRFGGGQCAWLERNGPSKA